jgi:hypothetical protein
MGGNKTTQTNTHKSKPLAHFCAKKKQNLKNIQSLVTCVFRSFQDADEDLQDYQQQRYVSNTRSSSLPLVLSNQKLKIKTKLEEESIYQLTFISRENLCYKEFMRQIFEKYQLFFHLVYQDEEGDSVSIYSEEEFQIALNYFRNSNKTPKFILQKV